MNASRPRASFIRIVSAVPTCCMARGGVPRKQRRSQSGPAATMAMPAIGISDSAFLRTELLILAANSRKYVPEANHHLAKSMRVMMKGLEELRRHKIPRRLGACSKVMHSEATWQGRGAPVGEDHGRGAHAEQGVGDQHAAVVPRIPVLRDILCAHHQCICIGLHLQSAAHRKIIREPNEHKQTHALFQQTA